MQGGYKDSGVWRPGEVDEAAFVYEVSESPADGDGNNNYWVIDYLAPPMQVSFDVTVPKGEEGDLDGAEAPDGAGIICRLRCMRRRRVPAGKTIRTGSASPFWMTAGAVVLRWKVTRTCSPTASFAARSMSRSSRGQQQNAIGPAEKVRGYPYLEDISVRGSNDGVQWSSGDGCDQAAVALVCSAPEPSEPTSEPAASSEPSSEPTSEPTSEPSGTSEPSSEPTSEPSSTTEPSEPSETSATTEPSEPGGSVVATGPDGKPTTVTSTKGPDGKPTVKTTVKSTPPGAAGQAKPPSGGRKWPVTGVEIAGLVALAGAAIALGMALVTWRRGRNGGQ